MLRIRVSALLGRVINLQSYFTRIMFPVVFPESVPGVGSRSQF
jgi:hypothetical protein